MFDIAIFVLIPLLALLVAGLVFAVPYLLTETESGVGGEDAWRDPAPSLFRLTLPLARLYAGNAARSVGSGEASRLQQGLYAAGLGYAVTTSEFRAMQWMMSVVGLLLGGGVLYIMGLATYWIATAVALPLGGFFYPFLWLRDAAKKRSEQISKEFPFFMDVLALSMRAGLTFPAAVQEAVSQLPRGPVHEEFVRYLRQTRTGVSRRVALDRLGERVQLGGVQNFVAAVNQAEETGGALSDVLADQAEQRRQERFNRAEKKANQAPVKMLFPLVALLFPITFLIIMFPIAVQLSDAGVINLF